MWRVLLGVALGAVLLAPSSIGAPSAVNLSGVITQIPGGIKVTIKNEGPDAMKFVWIKMPASVKHTSASADQGGGCAPGGDENTVRCYWGNIAAGETRTATIMTNVPYPANAGAQLLAGDFFNSSPVPAGTATGPPPALPCKCLRFETKLLPKAVALINPGDETGMLMEMTFAWEMTCSTGSGKCVGQFDLLPPQPALKLKTRFQPISGRINCVGPCGGTTTGTSKMKLYGGPTLAFGSRGKKVKSMKITVRRTCQGKASTARTLIIVFDRFGQIDKKKSKFS